MTSPKVSTGGRSVEEWRGKTPDERAPPRVRVRVFERYGGRCYRSGIKIRPGDPWACDHIVAIINGGKNVESNLAPILEAPHRVKTNEDLAIKTKTARVKAKHLGVHKSPHPLRKHPTLKRTISGKVVPRFSKTDAFDNA